MPRFTISMRSPVIQVLSGSRSGSLDSLFTMRPLAPPRHNKRLREFVATPPATVALGYSLVNVSRPAPRAALADFVVGTAAHQLASLSGISFRTEAAIPIRSAPPW